MATAEQEGQARRSKPLNWGEEIMCRAFRLAAAAAMLGVTIEETVGKPASEVFQQNPNLLNLFTRTGEQTLNIRLPKRRLA